MPALTMFLIAVRLKSCGNLAPSLRVSDNPPASAPQSSAGFGAHVEESPPRATPPASASPLHPSLAQLLTHFPYLAADPPPWRCEHCGLPFHPQMTEVHCCVGCWYRAQGKTHRVEGHTVDCRRWRSILKILPSVPTLIKR